MSPSGGPVILLSVLVLSGSSIVDELAAQDLDEIRVSVDYRFAKVPTDADLKAGVRLPNGRLLVGDANGGLWRADTAGTRWIAAREPDGMSRISSMLVHGEHVIAVSPTVVYESGDEGSTWDVLLQADRVGGARGVVIRSAAVVDGSLWLFGIGNFDGSWSAAAIRSTGSGWTAVQLSSPSEPLTAITFADSSIALVMFNGELIVVSTTYREIRRVPASPLVSGGGFYAATVDPETSRITAVGYWMSPREQSPEGVLAQLVVDASDWTERKYGDRRPLQLGWWHTVVRLDNGLYLAGGRTLFYWDVCGTFAIGDQHGVSWRPVALECGWDVGAIYHIIPLHDGEALGLSTDGQIVKVTTR